MTAEDALRDQVNASMRAYGLSQAEACRQLGVSTKHMYMMLKGRAPLTLAWAESILALCGLRVVVALQHAPEPAEGPETA